MVAKFAQTVSEVVAERNSDQQIKKNKKTIEELRVGEHDIEEEERSEDLTAEVEKQEDFERIQEELTGGEGGEGVTLEGGELTLEEELREAALTQAKEQQLLPDSPPSR